MSRTQIAIFFFVLMTLLQLGDFAGNILTLIDASILEQTAERLGITRDGELARVLVLLPLTFVVFLVYALVGYGFWRNTIWKYRFRFAALAAFVYAIFHQISFFTLPNGDASIAIAILYFGLAVLTLVIGRAGVADVQL